MSRLIDADDLLRLWSVKDGKRFPLYDCDNFPVTVSLVDVQKSIKDAPTVDAVPVVHAHWIEEDGIQICSNCGEEHEWEDYRADHCDTCGAKMDESVSE